MAHSSLGLSLLSSFPHPRVSHIEIILEMQTHGTCCIKGFENWFSVSSVFPTPIFVQCFTFSVLQWSQLFELELDFKAKNYVSCSEVVITSVDQLQFTSYWLVTGSWFILIFIPSLGIFWRKIEKQCQERGVLCVLWNRSEEICRKISVDDYLQMSDQILIFLLLDPAEIQGHVDNKFEKALKKYIFKVKFAWNQNKSPVSSVFLNMRCRQMKTSIPVHGHMIAIQAILFLLWRGPGVLLG